MSQAYTSYSSVSAHDIHAWRNKQRRNTRRIKRKKTDKQFMNPANKPSQLRKVIVRQKEEENNENFSLSLSANAHK